VSGGAATLSAAGNPSGYHGSGATKYESSVRDNYVDATDLPDGQRDLALLSESGLLCKIWDDLSTNSLTVVPNFVVDLHKNPELSGLSSLP
jgi:hypothetical protein